MKINKVERVILMIIAIFILSILFAVIDTYPDKISSFDLGRLAASIFKNMLKILGMIGIVLLTIRSVKKQ